MLTREHAIAEYEGGRVLPDRLERRRHGRYVDYAQRMLAAYRRGIGRTRGDLHRAVREVFAAEADCPPRRIEAFCKLLDDAAVFDHDRRGEAAALRQQVFRRAAASHPLVSSVDGAFGRGERQVKAQIAAELGLGWPEIDARLFADIVEFHRLKVFYGYEGGRALLARYNVAQTQAALFDAVEMTIWAGDDFKTIFRYAKLSRLLHTVRRTDVGKYVIRLDGPASLLRETRRYGAAMARFLPALLACRDWRMHALLRPRGRKRVFRLELSPADGLSGHLPPPDEFDSHVEAAFAEKWGDGPREGWLLVREGEPLCREQHVFVPDFLLSHADGRRVLLEIVGFWTPEYLEAKLNTLRRFGGERMIVALAESKRHQPMADRFAAAAVSLVRFKTVPAVKSVLDALRSL